MQPGPQFHQLPMFATAHELMHEHKPGDAPGNYSAQRMWDRKRRENRKAPQEGTPGLHPDVFTGVHTPVEVEHDSVWSPNGPMLNNGHHRTAAAYDRDPQSLVPVEHTDPAQQEHALRVHRAKRRQAKA